MFDNYLPLFEDIALQSQLDELGAELDQMLMESEIIDQIIGEEDESWMY